MHCYYYNKYAGRKSELQSHFTSFLYQRVSKDELMVRKNELMNRNNELMNKFFLDRYKFYKLYNCEYFIFKKLDYIILI